MTQSFEKAMELLGQIDGIMGDPDGPCGVYRYIRRGTVRR